MPSRNHHQLADEVVVALRRELLRLAQVEESLAADEAAKVPYWEPMPATVHGHRAAAQALRQNADRLLPTVA